MSASVAEAAYIAGAHARYSKEQREVASLWKEREAQD